MSDAVADGVVAHLVRIDAVLHRQFLLFVLPDEVHPVENELVILLHFVHINPSVRTGSGIEFDIIGDGIGGIRREHFGPIDDFVPRIGDSLHGGAVAGKQQGVALSEKARQEIIDDKLLRISEGTVHITSHFGLITDNEVVLLSVHCLSLRQDMAATGFADAVRELGGQRGVCHGVYGLDRIGKAEIDALRRADIHIAHRTDMELVRRGLDAFVGREAVGALMLVHNGGSQRYRDVSHRGTGHGIARPNT